jgi:putative ABC transport system permease protein
VLGRGFLPEEEVEQDRESVTLISHRLWQERFGGGTDVLGRTIQLNGRPFTVVGVMPRVSALPADVELFTPLGFSERERRSYRGRWLQVFGRLSPGVTLAEAQSELSAIAARVAQTEPGQRGWGVKLIPLAEATVAEVRPVLLSLMGAVAFLLLVACANVANLLLARATSRAKEMAVRAAIGASRGRLVRQLLVESVMLALLGGGLGVLIAQAGLQALLVMAPDTLPRAAEIGVDGRALAVAFALAVATGLGFGLAPAFQASRMALHETLKQTGRSSSEGRQRRRLRSALVVVEVAMALILLAGAGLLMRSFSRLLQVNPGFNPQGALITTIYLPRSRFSAPAQHAAYAETAAQRIAALPGVEAVAAATNIPFSEAATGTFSVPGRPASSVLAATQYLVGADYFRAMGIPVLRGRPFDRRDSADSARVAIINQALARAVFPGEDPIGRHILLRGARPREIVAVVGDVKPTRLDGEATLQTYEPIMQNPVNDFTLIVRGKGGIDPGLPAAIRRTIAELDPDQPTEGLRPLANLVGDSLARQRFALTLFTVFSAVALLLAAIGIYGVMAYTVSRRTDEIGIRIALGAKAGDIVRLVLSEGGRLVALGVGVGLVGALFLTRFLEKLLFGVRSYDPATFAGMVLLLVAVAGAACLLPARRATRVSPMVALRSE